jgi:hypothetical protein
VCRPILILIPSPVAQTRESDMRKFFEIEFGHRFCADFD